MPLTLRDCTFIGPALPEPFVAYALEGELRKRGLLPKDKGLEDSWESYRRKIRELGEGSGQIRVANHVLEPLTQRLGYATFERQDPVQTREGPEDGGWLMKAADGSSRLRVWAYDLHADLDSPTRRGHAYRFSPSRIAQRVLLAQNERVGLLTEGDELRLLICDPAKPESHIAISLDKSGGWRAPLPSAPDSWKLLLALASPKGITALPDLTERARLAQATVTKKLREQARQAIEGFIQEVYDNPKNQEWRAGVKDSAALAKQLWREGLVFAYRFLFIFKLEASSDPARAFSFASTSLWRNTYSPSQALAGGTPERNLVRLVIDKNAETGGLLESSIRALFKAFAEGLTSSELRITPLGGALFGSQSTPLLDGLTWGDRAVAVLLDRLLWTPGGGAGGRERVHYGTLDVEDLGRVYEAMLELEPGIAVEPMCRLRRSKLEVVLPLAKGEKYRKAKPLPKADDAEEAEDEADEEEDDSKKSKAKVEWREEIPAGRFYLRVGLGRKATGSYYTPHPFVRFLVQETLGPQVRARSPKEDPKPAAILDLKVLDPAMGSGHFLVEACRFLGDALYEACRLCDELALAEEESADKARTEKDREAARARAVALRKRVEDLPDPNNELLLYLPSRVREATESGLSSRKAEALCRRLVAVHCLYGVDKNPPAVELAKLALWLESYAEGLPLTFFDHRLVCGDSLAGPFFEQLLTYPSSGAEMQGVFAAGLKDRLRQRLSYALAHVRDLESSIGKDVPDLELKRLAKQKLDEELASLKLLAAAWSGGVMLGKLADDTAYEQLARSVSKGEDTRAVLASNDVLRMMAKFGEGAIPFDLSFPEIFHPDGGPVRSGGFDAVLGNPPWDAIQFKSKEFLAGFDLGVFEAPTKHERAKIQESLLAIPDVAAGFAREQEAFEAQKRVNDRLYEYQKVTIDEDLAGRQLDLFRVFAERNVQLLSAAGFTGVIVPSAFHANAGAAGVRRLYFDQTALKCCYSFENRNKLFDIDSRFRFAAIVAQRSQEGTKSFPCAFYLHDLEWLFAAKPLTYTRVFVEHTGGSHLTMMELRDSTFVDLAARLFSAGGRFGAYSEARHVQMQECPAALHMTHESWRFEAAGKYFEGEVDPRNAQGLELALRKAVYVLHEGKTFRDFDDAWGERPRFVIPCAKLLDLPKHVRRAQGYQLAIRKISSSTNERTVISCILPPQVVVGSSALVDAAEFASAYADRLMLCAILNTFAFDWCARQFVGSNVTLFVLKNLPIPPLGKSAQEFLSWSAARLSATHAGYAAMLDEVAPDWRLGVENPRFPLVEEGERAKLRADMDAVVADAFGLTRANFALLLSTFSHKSDPKAPDRCLAAFDALKKSGLDVFLKGRTPRIRVELPKPKFKLNTPMDADPAPLFVEPKDKSGRTAPK